MHCAATATTESLRSQIDKDRTAVDPVGDQFCGSSLAGAAVEPENQAAAFSAAGGGVGVYTTGNRRSSQSDARRAAGAVAANRGGMVGWSGEIDDTVFIGKGDPGIATPCSGERRYLRCGRSSAGQVNGDRSTTTVAAAPRRVGFAAAVYGKIAAAAASAVRAKRKEGR